MIPKRARGPAPNKVLRSYMAYEKREGSVGGAVLVYAFNIDQARRYAWLVMKDIVPGLLFVDIRMAWMRSGCEHMRRLPVPHVVVSPPCCVQCNFWFEEPLLEGRCEGCRSLQIEPA